MSKTRRRGWRKGEKERERGREKGMEEGRWEGDKGRQGEGGREKICTCKLYTVLYTCILPVGHVLY